MRPRLAVELLASTLALGQVSAHPDRGPSARTALDTVAYEVDFSPLNGAPAGRYPWRVVITFTFADGSSETAEVWGKGGPMKADHELFRFRLGSWDDLGSGMGEFSNRETRGECRESPSGERIAYIACRGRPIRSMTVSSEGLLASCRPRAYKVRWPGPVPPVAPPGGPPPRRRPGSRG